MAFKFEQLKIWQQALALTCTIGDLCNECFPGYELYSLSNQIRKAADSVVLNIAEGCTGQSRPEFAKFLGYALRSAIEVVSCLFIARKKHYIDEQAFTNLYKQYEVLCKMITKLRASLDK
jgi:four helix bundle protein